MNITTARIIERANRPALRLINTKDLGHLGLLSVQKKRIGSGDAATAVGLHPYQSPLELWLIKTGRNPGFKKTNPDDTTSPAYWSRLLEPIVAASYTKQTGHRVRKVDTELQHPDPDKAWMLAHIDREVICAPTVQILECKTADESSAHLWRNGVPEYVQLQVQHQLAVTGKRAADIALLMCGHTLHVHRIHRDERLIKQLIELEAQFWHYVITDTPPPVDGSLSSTSALQCLYPHDNSERLDLTQDREISALFTDMLEIRHRIMQFEQQEEQCKQRIKERMGAASHAVFETGSVSWKRCKNSYILDTQNLLAHHPELLARYSQIQPGSRRFVVQT